MIEWLSEWLRNIIAVILLAVFVELLMPNKAMLRYARLVVGLFVLLTIMSPLLRLIQGDLEKSLEGSFRLWDNTSARREVRMPTLEDIEREAEKLSGEREKGARMLTERTLEQSIVRQVEESTGTKGGDADVKLDDAGQRVEAVVITFAAAEPEPEDAPSGSADPPKRVEPVTVDIDVDPVQPARGESGRAAVNEKPDGMDEVAWQPVDDALDGSIRKLLQQNFGIDPGLVSIRRPADDGRKS